MAQMIQVGKEMIRINPAKNSIEYSTNGGRSWNSRCTVTSTYGRFMDLAIYGTEIMAVTGKGIYYSTNNGSSWHSRCLNSVTWGEFISLMDGGNELLAQTTKGLYYSTNEGHSWHKKH